MLTKIFPFLLWFKDYNGEKLRTDLMAGITVAMVLIPQSMAYAQLAGLPVKYGLYASFLPPMIAALFGSSRQLATGPVAVVSLMTAAALEPLATAGSEQFVAYAIILGLVVGCFQLFLGVFRLGLVVNLLSHPVVNGFTNAGAIIIATSQLSKMFGVNVDSGKHHYQTVIAVCKSAVHYTHMPTLLIGIFSIAIMVVLKRVNPKIPNVLVAVVVTTLMSFFLKFNNDKTIPLEGIQAPQVVAAIEDFNKDITTIDDLGKKKTELSIQLAAMKEEAQKAGHGHAIPSMEELDLEHQLAIIQADSERAKAASKTKRKALRDLFFLTSKEKTDNPLFYTADTLPSGLETDGRKWRLKVGNKVIKPDSIKLIGAGEVVGKIDKGLYFGIPKAPKNSTYLSAILKVLPNAIIISLLGFMEAIAIAKAMAAKTGQKLDPSQELIGQGLANIFGAFGQGYAVSGSFSRSAVNLQANAVSGISSVVTSIMVGVTLLFFTPLLYNLPQATLAAVIMMAVIGLINTSGFVHAWHAKRSDGIISIITFIATLYFAPNLEEGIAVGVGLTFIVFIYKNLRPRVALLSKSQDQTLRSATKFGLKECDHIAVVRFDGALIFTNATYLEDKVLEFIASKPDLKHVLIEASGINDVDASGEEALAILIQSLRDSGRGISFSGVKEEVIEVFRRTHLLDKLGEENIYPNGEKALAAIYRKIHDKGECSTCPLSRYIPIMESAPA